VGFWFKQTNTEITAAANSPSRANPMRRAVLSDDGAAVVVITVVVSGKQEMASNVPLLHVAVAALG